MAEDVPSAGVCEWHVPDDSSYYLACRWQMGCN